MHRPSRLSTLQSTDDRSSSLRRDAIATQQFLDFPSSTKPNTFASGLNHLKQGALPTRSLTALSTPHDHVLDELYKHPGKSEGALPLPGEVDSVRRSQTGDSHTSSKEANIHQNTKSHYLNELGTQEGAISTTPTASFASNAFVTNRLYDPFDGSPMGLTLPFEATLRDGDDAAMLGEGNTNEELWNHLSRVLDLQNQVARMHVDMEGVGFGKQTDNKGKGPLGNPPRNSGFSWQRTTSTGSAPGGDMGDEEGVDVVDEEAEKLKAREREFKKLATQFEGRKDAINRMMGKLDDLSNALKEFHSLQVPIIEFPGPSRSNPLSSNTDDQIQLPNIIPPVDSTLPGESSTRPSALSMSVPTPHRPHLHPALQRGQPNTPSDPVTNTRAPVSSLGRRALVPTLITDSIEPGPQTHMVESPASTISLQLPHKKVQ